jgi:hypothetical protein
VYARNTGFWNGVEWSALGQEYGGMFEARYRNSSGLVRAVAPDGENKVVAGGEYSAVGGINASNIAQLDRGEWNAFGSGTGPIHAMARDAKKNLYVGGSSGISKWDGGTWIPMASGLDGTVFALAWDKSGNLYAGGKFTGSGNTQITGVAKWDGEEWSRLRAGIFSANDTVYALACDKAGNVYAGGKITAAGGIEVANIAMWDGSDWKPLGAGLKYPVRALACNGKGELYAGGWFPTGPSTYSSIMKWNGSDWVGVGSENNGGTSALLFDANDNLYAGGTFYTSGGTLVKGVGKWDGNAWTPLGSGIDGAVFGMSIANTTLFVGGNFMFAGGKLSPGIASVNIHNPGVPTAAGAPHPETHDINCHFARFVLFIEGVEARDHVSVYTLSGRRVGDATGPSRIALPRLSLQPLLVRVLRNGQPVFSGLVMPQ